MSFIWPALIPSLQSDVSPKWSRAVMQVVRLRWRRSKQHRRDVSHRFRSYQLSIRSAQTAAERLHAGNRLRVVQLTWNFAFVDRRKSSGNCKWIFGCCLTQAHVVVNLRASICWLIDWKRRQSRLLPAAASCESNSRGRCEADPCWAIIHGMLHLAIECCEKSVFHLTLLLFFRA